MDLNGSGYDTMLFEGPRSGIKKFWLHKAGLSRIILFYRGS